MQKAICIKFLPLQSFIWSNEIELFYQNAISNVDYLIRNLRKSWFSTFRIFTNIKYKISVKKNWKERKIFKYLLYNLHSHKKKWKQEVSIRKEQKSLEVERSWEDRSSCSVWSKLNKILIFYSKIRIWIFVHMQTYMRSGKEVMGS